jgi:hypothetical protein
MRLAGFCAKLSATGAATLFATGRKFQPKSVLAATLANFADGLREFEAVFAKSSMLVAALPLTEAETHHKLRDFSQSQIIRLPQSHLM